MQTTLKRGTRVRFHEGDDSVKIGAVRELGSYTNSKLCVIPPGATNSYAIEVDHHLQPGTYFFSSPSRERCLGGRSLIIAIDDE